MVIRVVFAQALLLWPMFAADVTEVNVTESDKREMGTVVVNVCSEQ